MIGIAIALIVIGVLFGFFLPFGWIVGIVGLILAVLYFAGFGRRAARGAAACGSRAQGGRALGIVLAQRATWRSAAMPAR